MTRADFDKRFRRAKYSIIAMLVITLAVAISAVTMGFVSWWILGAAVVPVFQLYSLLATKCASCNKPLDQIAGLKGKVSETAKLSNLSSFEDCPHCGEAFFDRPR